MKKFLQLFFTVLAIGFIGAMLIRGSGIGKPAAHDYVVWYHQVLGENSYRLGSFTVTAKNFSQSTFNFAANFCQTNYSTNTTIVGIFRLDD
jgi:hypothetical protein